MAVSPGEFLSVAFDLRPRNSGFADETGPLE